MYPIERLFDIWQARRHFSVLRKHRITDTLHKALESTVGMSQEINIHVTAVMNAAQFCFAIIRYHPPLPCVNESKHRSAGTGVSALRNIHVRYIGVEWSEDLAALEISAAQYVIISVLAKRGVDSATQLCKDLSYDAGAMTRMIDRLEAKGLISRRRCPEDRRLVKLALTEAGHGALPKLRECSVRVLNQFMRGFSQAEARQLEGFLIRMLQNA